MRRGLHSGDEYLPGEIAPEAAKLFRSNDHHRLTPMHGDVLRSFAADAPYEFAKARFGILQVPLAWPVTVRLPPPGLRLVAGL